MTDLDRLIAAVEAGGWPDRRAAVAAFYSGGSISHCNECAGLAWQANAGSLDAALRLHEALLSGWAWSVECADAAEVWPTGCLATAVRAYADDGTPARAWLLAILRALKAREAA